jgi:hypothetical protein
MDRYRLAPVRDARARAEQVKRGDLAAAVGDARTTEARLIAARAKTAEARAALAGVKPIGETAADHVRADRFAARLRHALADAIAEELHAEAAHDARLGAIDDARRTLARARADREVIERHFARWRDDKKKLAERRED